MAKITMKMADTMAETFEDFLLMKKSMGLSEKTLSTYKQHLYKFVCDWFIAQFPEYEKIPVFEGNLTVIKFVPYPDKKDYVEKESKKASNY